MVWVLAAAGEAMALGHYWTSMSTGFAVGAIVAVVLLNTAAPLVMFAPD